MEIQWLGDTTFLIKTSTGKRILINPFDLNSSVQNIDFKPDIITLSNNICINKFNEYVNKGCELIYTCDLFCNDYISINGYITYCDNVGGLKRGENIIYIFEIENIKFCHLGTLGHKLDATILSKLTDIDFILIPIGGHFSLDGCDAASLLNTINSKYIIPMLYKSSLQHSYLDGPYKFISHMKNIITTNSNIIETSDFPLIKNNNTVIIFKQ
ncbi:MAG: MBL fold metallo-hydrolase [Clostridium sp.]